MPQLKCAEEMHLDHLQHEADAAKTRMMKQNLTPTEAEEIYTVIRGVGIKRIQ